MKASLLKKWTTALRSGNYKQARSRLKGAVDAHAPSKGTGHCCLGVLLDVVEPDGWTDGDAFSSYHKRSSTSNKNGLPNGYISAAFAHKLGIPAGVQKRLAMMNDSGASFGHIADAIEDLIPVEAD